MELKQKLKWVLAPLLVVLLAAFPDWQAETVGQTGERAPQATVVPPQGPHRHEATLTDATQLYRVCSSRPQRLLPTQGSKTERTTPACGLLRRQIVKPLHSFHDGRCRLETAPFCLSVSRNYYVIALRHIIR